MANSKISALTSATTPLAGTEVLPVVQSSATTQVTVANLTAGRAVNVLSLTATGAAATGYNSVALGGTTTAYNYAIMTNTGGSIFLGVDNSTGTNWSGGTVPYGAVFGTGNATPLQFLTNNIIRATLDTSANLTMASGNIIPATAAKGINFTANTPAAGKTSQLLNAYEEGTWTPAFTSTGATFGYAQQRGIYTRVGRLVTVSFYLRPNSITGTLTNALTITGLPFTSTATADYGSSGTWGIYQFASLKTMNVASSSTTITISDAGTITATLAAALISGFYLGSLSYTV